MPVKLKKNVFQKGFIDLLSLFALGFLTLSLITITAVAFNKDFTANFFGSAKNAVIDQSKLDKQAKDKEKAEKEAAKEQAKKDQQKSNQQARDAADESNDGPKGSYDKLSDAQRASMDFDTYKNNLNSGLPVPTPIGQTVSAPAGSCDSNGTAYPAGSVVVFGGSDYRKCIGGSWTIGNYNITELTTVPVYLQDQYNQAVSQPQQNQNTTTTTTTSTTTNLTTNFSQAKITCETNGGFWNTTLNICGQGQGNCEIFGGTWDGTKCNITKCVAKTENLGCSGGCRNERTTNVDCTVTTRCVASTACSPAPIINQPTTSVTVNQQGNILIKTGLGGSCRFSSECLNGLSCSSGQCGYGLGSANSLLSTAPISANQPPSSDPLGTIIQPTTEVIPQYGSCSSLVGVERDNCNKNLNTLYNISNTLTFGAFTNYVNAYSPDKVKIAWQEAGYESLQACQHDLGTRYGARGAMSCNTYNLTKDQAISSIQVGTAITADIAAVAALPTALTAGSVAAGASGATALSVTSATGTSLLLSVGAISTLTQTSNAATAQIEAPLSEEANWATAYAALSWANIGTADRLMSTFSNVGSTAQTIQSAKNLNTAVSAVNLVVDSREVITSCGQEGLLTGSCGGALAAAAVDIGFGALDYKQGQLSFGNPLAKAVDVNLVGPLPDISDVNGTRFATTEDLKLLQPSVNETNLVSQLIDTPSVVQTIEIPTAQTIPESQPNLLTIVSNFWETNIKNPIGDALFGRPTLENLDTSLTSNILGPSDLPLGKTGSDLTKQIEIDQADFLADTDLPNPKLIASDPVAYRENLQKIVDENGLNPLVLSENPTVAELQQSGAQVALDLMKRYDDNPDRILSYRIALATTDPSTIPVGSILGVSPDVEALITRNTLGETLTDEEYLVLRDPYRNAITNLQDEVRVALYIDPETGLLNKLGGDVDLRIKLEESQGLTPVAVVDISLANLKPVNDLLGHEVGDRLIKETGRVFDSIVGESGLQGARVVHIAGNKYRLILPGADEKTAQEILTRITDYIRNLEANNPSDIVFKNMQFDSGTVHWNGVETAEELSKRASDTRSQNKEARIAAELAIPTPNSISLFFQTHIVNEKDGLFPSIRKLFVNPPTAPVNETLGASELPLNKEGRNLTNQIKLDQEKILKDNGLPHPGLMETNPQEYVAGLNEVVVKNGLDPITISANPTKLELEIAGVQVQKMMTEKYGAFTPPDVARYNATLAVTDLKQFPLGSIPELSPAVDRIVFITPEEEILSLRQRMADLKVALDDARFKDPMTGLYNKAGGDQGLFFALETARVNKEEVSIIGIDVAGLNKINTELGAVAGDNLIKEAADIFDTVVKRSSDIVFRPDGQVNLAQTVHPHGDEFGIILPGTTKEGAEIIQRRMYEELKRRQTAAGPDDVVQYLGFDSGIAQWNRIETAEELMKRADDAMYVNKNTRKTQEASTNTGFLGNIITGNKLILLGTGGVTAGIILQNEGVQNIMKEWIDNIKNIFNPKTQVENINPINPNSVIPDSQNLPQSAPEPNLSKISLEEIKILNTAVVGGNTGIKYQPSFVPDNLVSLNDNIKGAKFDLWIEAEMVQEAVDPLQSWVSWVNSQGYTPLISDAYRSYETQEAYRSSYGNQAATPGGSCHQSGLCFDVHNFIDNKTGTRYEITDCLNSTKPICLFNLQAQKKAAELGIAHPYNWDQPHYFVAVAADSTIIPFIEQQQAIIEQQPMTAAYIDELNSELLKRQLEYNSSIELINGN